MRYRSASLMNGITLRHAWKDKLAVRVGVRLSGGALWQLPSEMLRCIALNAIIDVNKITQLW
jgi:hypothetical protein